MEDFISNIILEILNLNNASDMESIINVIIPQDFIDEIIHFETEHNLSTNNTNEKEYRVMGKCLKYTDNNIVKFALFYDISLILPLLLYPDKIFEYSYNLSYIEHEIIHAIDIYKHSNNYNYFSQDESYKDYNNLLINMSIDYWKEYLANRAGHYHSETDIKNDIDKLSEEILKYELEFKNIRKEYKYNGDLNLVVKSLNNQIDYLIKRCIYQLGSINSLENSNNIIEYFKNKIHSSLIVNIIPTLSISLENIYSKYPNLTNNDFIPIKNIIINYWSYFGISIKNTEQGIYFSIPYTFDLFE